MISDYHSLVSNAIRRGLIKIRTKPVSKKSKSELEFQRMCMARLRAERKGDATSFPSRANRKTNSPGYSKYKLEQKRKHMREYRERLKRNENNNR